jgi:hypothetical protein
MVLRHTPGVRKTSFSRIPVLFCHVLKDTHLRLKKHQKTHNSKPIAGDRIVCLLVQVVVYANGNDPVAAVGRFEWDHAT